MRNSIIFMAAVLAVVLITWGIVYGLVSYECSNYQRATGRETKMIGGSCYVRDRDSQWYGINQLRGVNP